MAHTGDFIRENLENPEDQRVERGCGTQYFFTQVEDKLIMMK
jgi:hypothetical protein